jgi:RNA polymerase sigma-70 factor (ECF subfamily)
MPPQDTDTARWFATEVHPHEAALRSYLRAHFPSLRDIDDLVQETYARLIQARHTGGVKEARPYLFTTARNAAIDLCRRNRIVSFEPIAKTGAPLVVGVEADAAATLDHDRELDLLAQAIGSLPERCRQVLTLRKLRGLSHRQIAEQLGISENTVSAQITHGVFRVREFFKAHGITRGHTPSPQQRSLTQR